MYAGFSAFSADNISHQLIDDYYSQLIEACFIDVIIGLLLLLLLQESLVISHTIIYTDYMRLSGHVIRPLPLMPLLPLMGHY